VVVKQLLSSAPLSEWEGVIVDANGRVTELRLSLNNLIGMLLGIV